MKRNFILYFFLFFIITSCGGGSIPSESELKEMTQTEKWDLLQVGMKEEDVLKILGKPESVTNMMGQKSYLYPKGGMTTIANGRLVAWVSGSIEYED